MMPIYSYECQTCGGEMEIFQKVEERETPDCHVCQVPMRRVLSPVSFELKGSGFYQSGFNSKH